MPSHQQLTEFSGIVCVSLRVVVTANIHRVHIKGATDFFSLQLLQIYADFHDFSCTTSQGFKVLSVRMSASFMSLSGIRDTHFSCQTETPISTAGTKSDSNSETCCSKEFVYKNSNFFLSISIYSH